MVNLGLLIGHFSDKITILTFDLIFKGQDLVRRFIFYYLSPPSIILCILTPRSSIHVLSNFVAEIQFIVFQAGVNDL